MSSAEIYALARAFDNKHENHGQLSEAVACLCDHYRWMMCAGESLWNEPHNQQYRDHMRRCLNDGWKVFGLVDLEMES